MEHSRCSCTAATSVIVNGSAERTRLGLGAGLLGLASTGRYPHSDLSEPLFEKKPGGAARRCPGAVFSIVACCKLYGAACMPRRADGMQAPSRLSVLGAIPHPAPSESAITMRSRAGTIDSASWIAGADPCIYSGPNAGVAGVGPVAVQMWQGWAQSRRRRGGGARTGMRLTSPPARISASCKPA